MLGTLNRVCTQTARTKKGYKVAGKCCRRTHDQIEIRTTEEESSTLLPAGKMGAVQENLRIYLESQ